MVCPSPSTRHSMGNRKNGRPADFFPSTVQKRMGKPARHAHSPKIDWSLGPSKSGAKIRSAASAIEGRKFTHKCNRRTENLTSTAADRVGDTKRKYNNQPNNHFIACLGRVSFEAQLQHAAEGNTCRHCARTKCLCGPRMWSTLELRCPCTKRNGQLSQLLPSLLLPRTAPSV